jgi:hypothetical protein
VVGMSMTICTATEQDERLMYPCDICDQPIIEGEQITVRDGGLTIEHTACTGHWWYRNFGREVLR